MIDLKVIHNPYSALFNPKNINSPNYIIEGISRLYDCNIDAIKGKSRVKPLPDCRKILSFLCKKYTKMSVTEIGKFINCNHATILYNIQEANKVYQVKKQLELIETQLF